MSQRQARAPHVPRVYVEQTLDTGALVEVRGDKRHHLANVLRLRVGAAVTVFNGRGGEYPALIAKLERQALLLECGQPRRVARESPLRIALGQAIARGERMDYAVAKAVELGVTAIQPLAAERGKVRLHGERAAKKQHHWQRVAIAAAEQSGRDRIATVAAPTALPAWLAEKQPATRLLLDPGAGQRLRTLAAPAEHAISILVGPESGWSAAELAQAQAAGFTAVGLGPRVLRAETAGVACLAAIQALWGDLA